MKRDSYLKALREAIADWLRGYGPLAGVPVLTRQKGDIEKQIEELMDANIGRCIVVFTPLIQGVGSGTRGLFIKRMLVRVKCAETPLLNNDEDAETLTEHVLQRLLLRQLFALGVPSAPLVPLDPATEDDAIHDDSSRREIDCLFHTSAALDEVPER